MFFKGINFYLLENKKGISKNIQEPPMHNKEKQQAQTNQLKLMKSNENHTSKNIKNNGFQRKQIKNNENTTNKNTKTWDKNGIVYVWLHKC